jgi:serine/threonine protein kinase
MGLDRGAGSTGEVYRARDTRFDRTIAIKILPTHLSSHPEAKQRFVSGHRFSDAVNATRQSRLPALDSEFRSSARPRTDTDSHSFATIRYIKLEVGTKKTGASIG